ncbi:hypothetical protein [Nocardia cyriacigeorgica]|uniref:hypothetical protein n=1 Tax=Nocardia cyriacigeorgica TaxID=135487 RepID=UPI000CEA31F5|nr:hypothetical protein [Nocardia cyriacigeorgica]AVH21722.1 hypothetical protein C5B73_09940 [Nocardia cyriacigeorgica]MBF6321208.1 hypothetical protein [Nocardia cyriacigeorgica]MBF6495098.1 hypothetical protein [Nocardia cyriacigeorgica]PPJ12774.1 hypothetical protein C5E43_09945 [Nocardia cyriacigeorgica]
MPLGQRQPCAAPAAFGLVVVTSLIAVPQELLWFAPVLLIKLLLGHLLPEEAEGAELRRPATGAAAA